MTHGRGRKASSGVTGAATHPATRKLVDTLERWFVERSTINGPQPRKKTWSATASDCAVVLSILRDHGWEGAVQAIAGFVFHSLREKRLDDRLTLVQTNFEAYRNEGAAGLCEWGITFRPSAGKSPDTNSTITLDKIWLIPSWRGQLMTAVFSTEGLPEPHAPYVGEAPTPPDDPSEWVDGIKAFRPLIEAAGGPAIGNSDRAVTRFLGKAGVLKKGSNRAKGRIRLRKAEVLEKLRGYISSLKPTR